MEFIFLIFGAVIGFGGNYILELIKEYISNRKQKENNKKIMKVLEREIEEGISRYEEILRVARNGTLNRSRIFVSFWDSVKLKLVENNKDIEFLFPLFRIYYYFDLVNFHAERGNFIEAAGFAIEYPGAPRSEFESFKKIFYKKIS